MRLDAQGQGRHVPELHQVREVGVPAEGGRVHCGAVRHGLVGVDGAPRLLVLEQLAQQGLHLGDARGAADQHHLVDGAGQDLWTEGSNTVSGRSSESKAPCHALVSIGCY